MHGRSRDRLAVVVVSLALVAKTGAAIAGEPLPYDLGVRVVYGEQAGPESLRDQIERVLVDDIRTRGCYRSVDDVASDDRETETDLVLKIRIDELVSRTQHDLGLAERTLSDRPEDRYRYQVETELLAAIGLLAWGSDSAALTRSFRTAFVVRPNPAAPDAERTARARLLDDIARDVGRWACKLSPSKLGRKIDQARAEDPWSRPEDDEPPR